MFRTRVAAVLCALVAPAGVVIGAGVVSPAHADAQSGVCASGYRLERYTAPPVVAKNVLGKTMYTITVRKRWCYSAAHHRIGTAYSPSPTVDILNEFNIAWSSSIIDSDAYYTSVGADGRNHPSYPRWGHVSWFRVKMCQGARNLVCAQARTYKVGIVGYSDGSKKLVG